MECSVRDWLFFKQARTEDDDVKIIERLLSNISGTGGIQNIHAAAKYLVEHGVGMK